MKNIFLSILAVTGLVLTLLPSVLVFTGAVSLEVHKQLMIVGFVLWFFAAPALMKRRQ
jgi:hypothetical protein